MIKLNAIKLAVAFCVWNATGFSFLRLQSISHGPTSNDWRESPSSSTAMTATQLHNSKNNMNEHTTNKKRSIHLNPSYSQQFQQLNSIETLCITSMDDWYSQSLKLKCPFMRRRMADFLDAVDMVMRFLIIRHKSLDIIGPPPGCRSLMEMSRQKHTHLSQQELLDTIRRDWRLETNKGYYITGRLNTTVYRDDCLFDGPDPDMPVRGLRKYLNAASQLFDHKTSTAKLLSLNLVNSNTKDPTIVAKWELEGVLHLPWHPKLPVWTGSTTYHLDKDGLIYKHEEAWDISVVRAFTETLLPDAANLIWKE